MGNDDNNGMDVAKMFYVEFLGLTVDEGNGKHFNLGQQQVRINMVVLESVISVMMILVIIIVSN